VRAVLAARDALAVRDLAIGGEDLIALGLSPGPLFGEVLAAALERVVEDPELNSRDRLLALVRDELLPARAGGAR
jgi:tRNA nucleotidyltransferase (CCA-adding enzyme)